jgi:DNA polymerase-3 subunit epsilon
MARKKFPFAQANLDALCRRFSIDNSNRELHGALLDAELLAEVYLQLIGGQQPDLILPNKSDKSEQVLTDGGLKTKENLKPRPHSISREESAAHEKFINGLKNSIWNGAMNEDEI